MARLIPMTTFAGMVIAAPISTMMAAMSLRTYLIVTFLPHLLGASSTVRPYNSTKPPGLTSLVVTKEYGEPSDGYEPSAAGWEADLQAAFEYDWRALPPLTVEDLRAF